MKRFLFAALLTVFTLVAVFSCGTTALAEESDIYQTAEEYVFVQQFVQNFPNRYGADNELPAANWLKVKFDEVLEGTGSTAQIKVFTTESGNGYNVVAKLVPQNPKTSQQIIIGAHYDSIGEGANDNAAGVAALYFTLKTFASNLQNLPCTVVFVAFGGEERGLVGSYSYVNSLSSAERENIAVMFNIDSIVNGDNLYLHCENKSTDLAKLILQNAPENSIREKPYSAGVYNADVYGYGYYEEIQNADQTPFRMSGVPTALLFSGNYVAWNYVESTDSIKNTMNTTNDTLANLDALNGAQIVNRIQTVCQILSATVTSQQFVSVAQNARNQLVNNSLVYGYWWSRLAAIGLILLMVLFAVLHYRKLDKQSILGVGEVKSSTVFSTPKAEDIFSFDDNEQKNKEIEDIFSVKK